MFHKAVVRLTALYLGIIMLISLAFSISLYQISVRELDRGFRRQYDFLLNGPQFENFFENFNLDLARSRQKMFNETKTKIIINLAIVNVAILISGGFLSYYLARRTLNPIEESHKAQSRFTADASHELRTPIAAMQAEIEVALMDNDLNLTQTKQLLKSNLEELAKLTSLTNGLLRLARLDSNHLEKSPLSVNELINDSLQRVASLAAQRDIVLKTKLPKDDISIIGDKDSLTEALVTILDNAIKYSSKTGKVIITAKKEQKHINVAIRDYGIGIEAKDVNHLFERFYRADTARSKNQTDGYGLGLAIAKNIVDLHSGKIEVTTQPGKGSTFEIKLPA